MRSGKLMANPQALSGLTPTTPSENIVSFIRRSPSTGREIVCVSNFSAVPKKGYHLRLPRRQSTKW